MKKIILNKPKNNNIPKIKVDIMTPLVEIKRLCYIKAGLTACIEKHESMESAEFFSDYCVHISGYTSFYNSERTEANVKMNIKIIKPAMFSQDEIIEEYQLEDCIPLDENNIDTFEKAELRDKIARENKIASLIQSLKYSCTNDIILSKFASGYAHIEEAIENLIFHTDTEDKVINNEDIILGTIISLNAFDLIEKSIIN